MHRQGIKDFFLRLNFYYRIASWGLPDVEEKVLVLNNILFKMLFHFYAKQQLCCSLPIKKKVSQCIITHPATFYVILNIPK